MKQTENLQLPMLQSGDKYTKETQNEAFKKIDLHLGGLAKRVNNIVASGGESNIEIVDARRDNITGVVHNTIGERINSVSEQLDINGERINSVSEQLDTTVQEIKDDSCLMNDVVVEKFRDEISNTTYWITTISKEHKINVGVSEYYENNNGYHDDDGLGTNYEDNNKLERASDFAKRKKANCVINGGIWGNSGFIGPLISNGIIKNTLETSYYTLGFRDNNEFVFYPPNTSSQTILNDGIKNCVSGFVPIIMNGVKSSENILNLYVGGNTIKAPRQCIGIKEDGTIIILTCDGRAKNEDGMLLEDLARVMLSLNVYNAYNLDGGGSATTVVNGVLQNKAIDINRTKERKVSNFIYFKKESVTKQSDDMFSLMYEVEKLKRQIDTLSSEIVNLTDLNKGFLRLLGEEEKTNQGIESWQGKTKTSKLVLNKDIINYWDYLNEKSIFNVKSDGSLTTSAGTFANFYRVPTVPTDLNSITENGIYWTNGSITNSPGTGALIHVQINNDSAVQFLFAFRNNFSNKQRSKNQGVWEEWK